MDRQLAGVAARSRVKDDLVRDLIEGKTTLRAVNDRFLAMNAECPANMSSLRSRFEGMADEELMARVVLDSVDLLVDVPADRKRDALARLGAEFAREFGPRPEPYENPAVGRQVAVEPRSGPGRIGRRQIGPGAAWRVRWRWARAIGQGIAQFVELGDARPQQ